MMLLPGFFMTETTIADYREAGNRIEQLLFLAAGAGRDRVRGTAYGENLT